MMNVGYVKYGVMGHPCAAVVVRGRVMNVCTRSFGNPKVARPGHGTNPNHQYHKHDHPLQSTKKLILHQTSALTSAW